jgi:hypothetical protein
MLLAAAFLAAAFLAAVLSVPLAVNPPHTLGCFFQQEHLSRRTSLKKDIVKEGHRFKKDAANHKERFPRCRMQGGGRLNIL